MQKFTLFISLLAICLSSYSLYMTTGSEQSSENAIFLNEASQMNLTTDMGSGTITDPCTKDIDCKKRDTITQAYKDKTPEECRSLEDPKMIATCVDHISFIEAVESKKTDSCKKIKDTPTREDCEKYIQALIAPPSTSK